LTCLAAKLPAHCEAGDTQCLCESQRLAVEMSACMQANCTMADGLVVAKVQAALCQFPHPNKSKEGTAALSILFTFAVFVVVLRLVSRLATGEFFADDYLIVLALVSGVTFGDGLSSPPTDYLASC
jgi:hypothetical protein